MKDLNVLLQKQFDLMCKTGKLFRSSIDGRKVWDMYITSFLEEFDPVFRDPESSEHNCNHCKNFIRRYGNIVALDSNMNIMTIFDVDVKGEYEQPMQNMSKLLKTSKISDIFIETYNELNSLPYEKIKKGQSEFLLGIPKNVKQYSKEEAAKFGIVKENEIRTFNHFSLSLPSKFVDNSGRSESAYIATYRDSKNVFKRALDEISLDTLELVRDLINQGSLLDGATHLYKINDFIKFKKEYDSFKGDKDNWCWYKSYDLPIAKFKNELIGVLCSELAEGKELNEACKSWNYRVDPANYMKVTAPFTAKQKADVMKLVEEKGYEESFIRRCATIDDIKASEILHINSGDGSIKKVSVFDSIKPAISTKHKRNEFDKVEEVSIEKFMKDILPTCTSVEAFLLNSHKGNMVTLTTAENKDSKKMFKWNNNYSWTYNGNLAGKSQIKEAVKLRGGITEGCLNIRLAFPNTTSDYDLHVIEPSGKHIYYNNLRYKHPSSGMLDLDANGIDGFQIPSNRVENIIYTNKSNMEIGEYLVYVNNFSKRDKNYGFTVEIETDNGDVTTFTYDSDFNNDVKICKIELNRKGEFKIIPILPIVDSNSKSTELYGLNTNEFHKVNLVCLSPNYWDDNNVGNKHYFFMLQGCKSPNDVRTFHNENLNSELAEHRKVLEPLGATLLSPSIDNQLSGLGFNATVADEIVLRLQGSHKRIIKVKF